MNDKLLKSLVAMKSKTFQYGNNIHYVSDVKIDEEREKCIIQTNIASFERPFEASGIYMIENHLRYLQEIETELHPEYNLHPNKLSKRDEKKLSSLKKYLMKQGEKNNIKTEWGIHPQYGYNIPYIDKNTSEGILQKIRKISYPI